MAIYHLEAKVVTRGVGRSACAASAYLSCSKILNDYDGVQHDYTRKKGLVWEQVFLPEYAPVEWQDRAVLWNAVEETEKTRDSRLAREFVAALPIELGKDEWLLIMREFIQENFVAEGMCADVAIHDPDPPGHNPHAHIMLTVRPLDEQGQWQYKTEKEYLCVKDGKERGFTAAEFKVAQADGWEKQYQYKVGRKKMYMAPSAAEAQGLVRASKHPKSTKYGRQNPIAARWNSEEQLVIWRQNWADVVNRHLAKHPEIEARIDHRSHAARGLDEQPTIHEGVAARALEVKGIISDRCELNRQIKADNALLRELKTSVKKLTDAVMNTIPTIADAMEAVREKIIVFCYQLSHIRTGKQRAAEYVSAAKSEMERYTALVSRIKAKGKERKTLLAEKDSTPFWNVPKHKELSARIAELSELLEELRSEKAIVLNYLQCSDDRDVSAVKKDIAKTEAGLAKLEERETKYEAELKAAQQKFDSLKEQAADFDPVELYDARQAIRPEKEQNAVRRVQNAYGNKYNAMTMFDSKRETSRMLAENAENRTIQQLKQERQRRLQREHSQRQPKKKREDWER